MPIGQGLQPSADLRLTMSEYLPESHPMATGVPRGHCESTEIEPLHVWDAMGARQFGGACASSARMAYVVPFGAVVWMHRLAEAQAAGGAEKEATTQHTVRKLR